MTQTENNVNQPAIEMKRLVCEELEKNGYTLELHGYRQLVATKEFASVVGKKVAYVELTGFSTESVVLYLAGNMTSEGNNCLWACTSYIPKPLEPETVARCVAEFSAAVNKAVAGLVIVRLLQPPPCEQKEGPAEFSEVAL